MVLSILYLLAYLMLKNLVKMHYNELHLIVEEYVTQKGQIILSGHMAEQVFK
jgi:hypothetical protein